MVDPMGITALAIAVIDDGCVVVNFIVQWVTGSKAFGADVRAIKTRFVTQSAKLKAINDFLRSGSATGFNFNEIPVLRRTAILGMVQELEILFASYNQTIQKHDLSELSRGYTRDTTLDVGTLYGDEIKTIAKHEAKAIQTEAGRIKVVLWASSKRKRFYVFSLV